MIAFHEITEFKFNLGNPEKKHVLYLEYSVLHIHKTYKLITKSNEELEFEEIPEEEGQVLPVNKLRLYYYFLNQHSAFLDLCRHEKL